MKKLLIVVLLLVLGIFTSCAPMIIVKHSYSHQFSYSPPVHKYKAKHNYNNNFGKNANKKLSYSTPKYDHKSNVVKNANKKLSYDPIKRK